ncbi:hypothetical protein B5M09_004483 [Aphanomyces astaci]|uniref:Uncharacterized protein n=1 Tax=Aphanomyces astaci TaxID=112090 RepID=A0A3R7XE91_APHAT|nr:hypothetical protein B5M09_004483 [Aphanomyces astaci]
MKLPLWLQAHRSAILEACGGRHYLAVHRRFVRSMLSPSSHIEELTSLLHKEPPEDDPDTADSYTSCDQCTVFVPSLAVPLLPHLRHIGTFTSVRLRKARLTYHPMTPLLTACTETAATLDGNMQPYMVLAKFHRKFVDVNRAIHDDAYVPKKALAARMYAHYHSTLVHVLQDMWLRFPMFDPLLLDIHGQRAKTCPTLGISAVESKDILYTGTRNGRTLHSLPLLQR